MSDITALTAVLGEAGPWTYAYVDGPGPEPQVEEEAKQEAVRRRLAESGAPDADVDAVMAGVLRATGLPAPSARYIVARGGDLVVDAAYATARIGPEHVGSADVPPLLPLLQHERVESGYLIVEADREGAHLRWGRGAHAVEHLGDVDGDAEALSKVQAGGLSHARYQRSAEESWSANQDEVAQVVDRLVDERRPAFIVLAGDVRARQLLRDELAPASRELVVDVDAHTGASGADDAALDAAVDQQLDEHAGNVAAESRDRAEAGGGRRGAHGIEEVMEALQQAQVETLLLDARLWESDRTLDALAAAPWVDDGDRLEVGVVARVAATEALARAALLTDALVVVEGDEPESDDAPRDDRAPRAPLAVLRWSDD